MPHVHSIKQTMQDFRTTYYDCVLLGALATLRVDLNEHGHLEDLFISTRGVVIQTNGIGQYSPTGEAMDFHLIADIIDALGVTTEYAALAAAQGGF